MEKDNWIPGQKSMIWMELCSKMRDCGTCTRSQFWKGDSDRRQFLTQQQEFAGRREKRQREGKGQAPPSPGDELERSPRSEGVVGKTRSTISNCIPKQTGQSVRALRCLKCKFSPRETKSELYELLWHATTAAPKHLCADPAFPRFAFICQAKRWCSDSARQHSPAENRCGSTSAFSALPHAAALQQFAVIMHKDVQVQPTDSLFLGAAIWGTLQVFGYSHSRRSPVQDAFSYRPEDVLVTLLPSWIKTGKWPNIWKLNTCVVKQWFEWMVLSKNLRETFKRNAHCFIQRDFLGWFCGKKTGNIHTTFFHVNNSPSKTRM